VPMSVVVMRLPQTLDHAFVDLRIRLANYHRSTRINTDQKR
jgi:hypothetical protein